MAELRTKSGDVLTLDDEDAALFVGIRIYSLKTKNTTYGCYPARLDGKSKTILVHRVIMDAPQGIMIDHINRDGLDCRRANMRFATNAQNQANRAHSAGTTSRHKGVTWHEDNRVWGARIVVGQSTVGLGSFKDEDAAGRAYDRAAVEAWGEFARLNFPGEALWSLEEITQRRRTIVHGESEYRGVSPCTRTGRWQASVFYGGKAHHLGRFPTAIDAARMADRAVLAHGCDPGRLNFPAGVSAAEWSETEARIAIMDRAMRGASPYRGVSWNTKSGAWMATIQVNGKQRWLGRFSTQEAAARCRDAEAWLAWHDKSKLNFPNDFS